MQVNAPCKLGLLLILLASDSRLAAFRYLSLYPEIHFTLMGYTSLKLLLLLFAYFYSLYFNIVFYLYIFYNFLCYFWFLLYSIRLLYYGMLRV